MAKDSYSLPTVSWRSEIGITKNLEVNLTDGLIPTKLFTLNGDKILPSASVPKEASASEIELPNPLPEEFPLESMFE
jgi:hypothetical protein